MNIRHFLIGTITVEITTASAQETLLALKNAGIIVYDLCYKNELTFRVSIHSKDYKYLRAQSERYGFAVQVVKKSGVWWSILNLRKRMVLIIGLLILLFVSFYIPTRVLFVQVQGNENISTDRILEKAQMCGIRFLASRRDVRSEVIKNRLLAEIPELSWTGVNTYGCIAVISVKERKEDVKQQDTNVFGNIVASCDGVITSVVTRKGNCLCQVGQAVTKDQILVSGFTDCGLTIKADSPDAEIFAETRHQLDAYIPAIYDKRTVSTKETTNYSILLGKNLIKLSQHSGIPDASCGKIYKIDYLTLPGGFQLPVALVTESVTWYTYDTSDHDCEKQFEIVRDQTKSYLLSTLISGEINHIQADAEMRDDFCFYSGTFDCVEMIGRFKTEELFYNYGEDG